MYVNAMDDASFNVAATLELRKAGLAAAVLAFPHASMWPQL